MRATGGDVLEMTQTRRTLEDIFYETVHEGDVEDGHGHGDPSAATARIGGQEMNAVWMIASGTFGEAMRRKILNVFLFVALALIVMGFAFASFQPRQEIVLIKSLGLGVIVLAGVFISVILGINLIPKEIERRTIYTILSKPVQRYQFLCGKFLGGLMTVLSNIALMGIALIV